MIVNLYIYDHDNCNMAKLFIAICPDRVIKTDEDLLTVLEKRERSIFIGHQADFSRVIARKIRQETGWNLWLQHTLISYEQSEFVEFLRGMFNLYSLTDSHFSFLPLEEFATAITSEECKDLFIGGAMAPSKDAIMFIRGNVETIYVPTSTFKPSGNGTQPDFAFMSLIDYGQTIQFGEYEASTSAVLYEYDKDFCNRYKQNLITQIV